MKRIVLAGALIVCTALPTSLNAAIEGYSHITISGFQLFYHTGAGGVGAPIVNGTDISLVTFPTFSSNANADITSIPNGVTSSTTGVASSIPDVGIGFGLDTASAYEGSAPPPQNDFTNLGAPVPHAHADTFGTGGIIAGLPFGVAAPASIELVSEVDLATGLSISDDGSADSSTTSTASFTFTVLTPIDIIGIFDASIDLVADLVPSPPGVQASADTSFNITLTDATGAVVFEWTPNGGAGGITGGTEWSDPFHLNDGRSAFPGTTSPKVTGPGSFSASVFLTPGNYTFNSEISTSASARTVGVIPEPSALIIWGALGLCMSGIYVRRTR